MDALSVLDSSVSAGHSDPLKSQRWTDPQREYLSLDARSAVWLAANQIGKSTALAADIVYGLRGQHAFKEVRPAPITALAISYSNEQMRPLLGKIWHFLGGHERPQNLRYSPGYGLRGTKYPHLEIAGGPGEGSILYILTYRQGTEAAAGFTLDAAFGDEPMPQTVYGELVPRLTARHGTMRIVQTVTPASPPQAFLRELCEQGLFDQLHTPFSIDAITPRGGLVEVPWLTEEEAEDSYRQYLGDEIGLRRFALWEVASGARWILNFEECDDSAPPERAKWSIGIDHGEAAGKQTAMLCAILDEKSPKPRVWWVDEIKSDGRSTQEQDAQAILAMLDRNGLTYDDVTWWTGDYPTGKDSDELAKSNQRLAFWLAKVMGRDHVRPIIEPPKGADSVRAGARVINRLLGTRSGVGSHGRVHTRCAHFAESLRRFDGTSKTEKHKDIFDAGRYAVVGALEGTDRVLRFTDRFA